MNIWKSLILAVCHFYVFTAPPPKVSVGLFCLASYSPTSQAVYPLMETGMRESLEAH